MLRGAREAFAGRRGPAFLEIPHDFLSAPVRWRAQAPLKERALPPEPIAVERALRVLQNAKRAVIWAGGGAVSAGAADLLTKVAETLDAPVVTTYAAKGLLEPDHPLLVGFPPHQPEVTKLLSSSDAILIVGSDLDGMNTQDNLLKSSNGFFSYIYTPIDAVEEITLTTSAAEAMGGGEGAANIKFVTRSGTNNFHGGVFWQNRNSYFNANYYFNNINGQPRDIINLNQFGGHVGGPIKKNKLFFFTNVEAYKLPNTYNFTRQVLTQDALNGNFTYKGSDGAVRSAVPDRGDVPARGRHARADRGPDVGLAARPALGRIRARDAAHIGELRRRNGLHPV